MPPAAVPTPSGPEFARRVLAATARLSRALQDLEFAEPVAHVYNPLQYAWPLHEMFVRRWGCSRRRVLFLGMNPGPWGMAQTGVPFGEVAAVKGWLGLDGQVGRPRDEHPRRPIAGLACPRSEVSGRRLWGLFADRFVRPENFFAEHFVLNYCPLAFLEASGRNRTPDKLPAGEAGALYGLCDAHLRAQIELYRPAWLVGIGGFASKRLESQFKEGEKRPAACKLATVLHPSPASPAANRGWAEQATAQLTDQGVW